MDYVLRGRPGRQACSCSDRPGDSGPGTCTHTSQLVQDNRLQYQTTGKLLSSQKKNDLSILFDNSYGNHQEAHAHS